MISRTGGTFRQLPLELCGSGIKGRRILSLSSRYCNYKGGIGRTVVRGGGRPVDPYRIQPSPLPGRATQRAPKRPSAGSVRAGGSLVLSRKGER
ncbi:uncharacterized protein CIMG_13710 [Coccidioides immitis RS]|uniref:Uncharacterized protein n=1 Tax=Coccidioides immitis (strain RS) TaxID=246410 RepID=J3KBA6_COCIM|nr:uncharacterized protein CIMG_13710 [Coccidioides immitis RS]EAS32386.3 hypothetical protein CIMG_13710 [Coccidioides immitis RS]